MSEGALVAPPDVVPGVEREAQLRDYLAVLRRHRWAALAVVAVVVGATALVTYRQTPLYRAGARINIRRDPPPGANTMDTWGWITTQREYMETQYKLIRSRAVARRALELTGRLGTPDWPDTSTTLDAFLATILVEPLKDTFLVQVVAEGPDRDAVARDANAVVDAFVERAAERQTGTALEKMRKIEEELPRVQERLRRAQEALQEFQKGNEVHSFEDHRRLIHQTLAKVAGDLVDIQAARRAAEARLGSVRRIQADGGDLTGVPGAAQSRVLEVYRQQEILVEQERLDLLGRYKPGHPAVRAAEERLVAVRARIAEELDGIARRIDTEFAEHRFQEADLAAEIERQRGALRELEGRAKEFEFRRDEVGRIQGEYEELAKQQNAIQSSSSVNLNNVLIEDRAEPPLGPFKPDPFLNLTLALVVGCVAGIGLAFLLEHLDDTLQSPEDVERVLGLPVVAMIPHAGDKDAAGEQAVVVRHAPHTAAAEAFRALRTALLFSPTARSATHLLVTSAAAGEGKTFVSSNLATVLAQGGARTLLLDADLRRPQVHHAFGVPATPGLAEVLAGTIALEAALRPSGVPNLTLLPAGALPGNPSELLGGAAMAALLADLERKFDRVVIDTPPVQAVTDPCVVAALAHVTLPVVSAAHVSRTVARRASEALRRVGARVLGVVLNQVTAGPGDYGYPYYAGYSRPRAADGPAQE